ncbi:DinB family protein [Gemmatimonas sp.]|uniref:DinB family protein n=1 Tax=Gemmatimonas sp. TaxID=1962908 RepID=UPI003983BEC3
MYASLASFHAAWQYESDSTQKLLTCLTDRSLSQPLYPGGRTVGRLAWHLAQSIPEMLNRTGLVVSGAGEHDAVPAHAAEICTAYRTAAASVSEQLQATWTDATLLESDDMYGETWPRGMTIDVLIKHQAHHRGQLSVGMRQAGLVIPGMYGPAKEEWDAMGIPAPE